MCIEPNILIMNCAGDEVDLLIKPEELNKNVAAKSLQSCVFSKRKRKRAVQLRPQMMTFKAKVSRLIRKSKSFP